MCCRLVHFNSKGLVLGGIIASRAPHSGAGNRFFACTTRAWTLPSCRSRLKINHLVVFDGVLDQPATTGLYAEKVGDDGLSAR